MQRWVHALKTFHAHAPADRDNLIGRNLETNVELEDAPQSAHVKRTAQEDFEPDGAFMVRRSMPWADSSAGTKGLMFVGFIAHLNRLDQMLTRMAGLEDGIADGLFKFSTAETGAIFWVPPIDSSGRLLV